MSRRTARQHAFQLIFQLPFHDNINLNGTYDNYIKNLETIKNDDEDYLDIFDSMAKKDEDFYKSFISMSDKDKNFIYNEFKGVSENLEQIDSNITKNLKNWTIDRIEKELLAIIRIAIYEMIYDETINTAISINEAVELAKTYSDEPGRKFVHGLLSSVAKEL